MHKNKPDPVFYHSNAEKIFVNAIFESLILQYLTAIFLFIVAPLGLLYFYSIVLKMTDSYSHPVVIIFTALVFFIFILLAAFSFFLRKYWVYKITTNHSGIAFVGFFNKIHSSWEKVISIKILPTFLSEDRVEVKTANGNFFFPLTMKEKQKNHPRLSMELSKWKWVDANYNEKSVTPENCPLYIEIQKNLNNLHNLTVIK